MLDWNRFEAVTFDCYGTLIDWETGILDYYHALLVRHNESLSDEGLLQMYAEIEKEEESGPYKRYRDILRDIAMKSGRRLSLTPSHEEIEGLAEGLPLWQPFPDTLDALRSLKKRYRLGVISNVDDELFAETNRALGEPFDWIITAEQAKTYKPSLYNFQLAQERIGLPTDKLLHVAQSLYHDIAPTKSLGWSNVWINRPSVRAGHGATVPSDARADVEAVDLRSLVGQMGL